MLSPTNEDMPHHSSFTVIRQRLFQETAWVHFLFRPVATNPPWHDHDFETARLKTSSEFVPVGGSPGGSPDEDFVCRAMPLCAVRYKYTSLYTQDTYVIDSALCRGVPHPAKLCQKRPFFVWDQEVAGSNPVAPIFFCVDAFRGL